MRFQKFQLQNFENLNEENASRKLFSPLPDKSFLRFWNKNCLTEIYRNIMTFTFQVLQKSSSWACTNAAVQMLFSDSNQKHVLAVLREYSFYNVEWVEKHKMSMIFLAKLRCESKDIFSTFCWLWYLLPDKLQYELFNNLFPGPNFVFRDCFNFSQCNLKFIHCGRHLKYNFVAPLRTPF